MSDLDEQDVVDAFRFILGREPESPEVIEAHLSIGDFQRLREVLLSSAEFGHKFEALVREHPETFARWAIWVMLARAPRGPEEVNDLAALGSPQRIREAIVNSDEFRYRRSAYAVTTPAQPAAYERCRRIFMHVPKTGGTSVHAVLTRLVDKERVCPERWNGLYGYTLEEMLRYELFSGHYDYHVCLMIPARERRIASILRDPFHRLVSLYHFQRAHREWIIDRDRLELARLANKYDIADFFRAEEVRAHPSIDNTYVRTLTGRIPRGRWEHAVDGAHEPVTTAMLSEALNNLEALDACGILEDFETSLRYILSGLGLDAGAEGVRAEKKMVLDEIVQKNPGLRPVDRQEVTPAVRRAMEDLVAMDMEVYEAAKKLMTERMADGVSEAPERL